jgi:hypothetical protein
MKMAWIGFVTSFLVGYAAFAWSGEHARESHTSTAKILSTRASSGREMDLVDEYQELMLDDEENFKLSLEKANRLADLLGLAEKNYQKDDWESEQIDLLVRKLVGLSPKEALDYYETFPTDASMNRSMYQGILFAWADTDFKSCISYLKNKPNISKADFQNWWLDLARDRMKSHPQDCIDVFRDFSADLQRDLMENMGEELWKALLPVLKDQQLASEIREQEAKFDEAITDAPLPKVPTEVESLQQLWKKEWPASDIVVKSIRSLATRKERRDMLEWVTEPRESPDEDPQAWLERISQVMRLVGDTPSSLPEFPYRNSEPYSIVLREWLPKQSPEIQRACAESVVRFQEPQEAFAWIEKLSTESLRQDMRDLAWERWTSLQGKEAAAAMMEQATAEEREMHLPDAVYGWAKWDFAAAKQWLDSQPDSEAKSQALQKIGTK